MGACFAVASGVVDCFLDEIEKYLTLVWNLQFGIICELVWLEELDTCAGKYRWQTLCKSMQFWADLEYIIAIFQF